MMIDWMKLWSYAAEQVRGEFDGGEEWSAWRRSWWMRQLVHEDAAGWTVEPSEPPQLSAGSSRGGAALDPAQSYIFACSPHGTMPTAWGLKFVNSIFEDCPSSTMPPPQDEAPTVPRQQCPHPVGLMASVIFRLPVSRTISLWSGALNACDSTIDLVLSGTQPVTAAVSGEAQYTSRLKRSVALVPGGISEMLLQSRSRTRAGIVPVIKRKGFIRAALRHGTPIVPCFGFGVNEMYHHPFAKCYGVCIQAATAI